MADGILIANGRDLSDFNFRVASLHGLPAVFSIDRGAVPMIGRAGAVRTSPDPDLRPRPVTAAGYVRSSSVAAADADIQSLLEWIGLDTVELRTGRNAEVMYFASLVSSAVDVPDPQLLTPGARLELGFSLASPLAYAVAPKTYVVAATGAANRIDVPIGTGPSTPLLRLFGSATNPIVTLRNAIGDILKQVTYTVTLDADDYLESDSDLQTHVLSNNGSASFADSVPGTGDPFFYLDPRDADRAGGAAHTFEVSAGRLEVVVRETFLL